ncbi:hypothetical protein GCM10011409_45000 [Lentibacillus populi]|uniref:Uncharacterized protein n=1 Tax=Lentibacillus populi TaxID=1827502 RepID=A0A9W5X7L7_9BACI|nr:hypothetical protein GCM10011409_45000 [Lentibacillus populi]
MFIAIGLHYFVCNIPKKHLFCLLTGELRAFTVRIWKFTVQTWRFTIRSGTFIVQNPAVTFQACKNTQESGKTVPGGHT